MLLPILFTFVIFHLPNSFGTGHEERELKNTEDTLQSVYGPVIFSSMLFRHGQRYRAFQYPGDENAEFYARKWGELTQAGKYQMYDLGRWARARYAHILELTPYDADVLHTLSSGLARCIMSAELFLAGFYPPTTENERWNNDFQWQPIPVYSDPKELDKTLRMTKYCSRYNQEVLRVSQNRQMQQFYEDNISLFDSLKWYAKLDFQNNDVSIAITEAFRMHDNFAIDERYGLPRPQWAEDFSKNFREMVTAMYFKLSTYNEVMQKLKAGNLVQKMIVDMVRRRDKPTEKKRFQLYSAHDSTVAALLNTLNLFERPHQPPYGSLVMVDLREKLAKDESKKYYVTISYRKSDDEPPQLLEMPHCSNPCTLDEFVTATKPIIPDDWEHECEYLTPNYNEILF